MRSDRALDVRTLVSSAQPGESRTADTFVAARMNLRRLPQEWRQDGKMRNNLSDKGSEKLAARIAIIEANVTCERKLYRVFIGRVAQFACETIHVGRELQGGGANQRQSAANKTPAAVPTGLNSYWKRLG